VSIRERTASSVCSRLNFLDKSAAIHSKPSISTDLASKGVQLVMHEFS
jgi:hypothetical protein